VPSGKSSLRKKLDLGGQEKQQLKIPQRPKTLKRVQVAFDEPNGLSAHLE